MVRLEAKTESTWSFKSNQTEPNRKADGVWRADGVDDFKLIQKIKWIAFNRDNPNERILFDNHVGKKPHYHENGTEVFFTWISQNHAQQMFYEKIIKKFGSFKQRL